MFNKFKEKLKNFFSKVRKEEKEEKTLIIDEKEEKKEKEIIKKEEKEIGEKIFQDIEKEDKKTGIFTKFKERFKRKITEEKFDIIWQNLEEILIENNVAFSVVRKIKEDLKKNLIEKEIKKSIEEDIKEALKESIKGILKEEKDIIEKIKNRLKEKKPYVIVFFGINGTGKTTTIAKLSYLLQKNKLSCVLSASDTFRAASIEQLSYHASKLKVPIIKSSYGADPASVAFDAIQYAKAHNIDVVLIDTAGRMHTQTNLIREMEKIVRVSKPDLKLFVGEAIAGNDIVEQVKIFDSHIGIDGIILSKADVDEKSGSVLSVSYITNKPILFLGTGQKYDDLEIFEKEKIIKRIFE
ncbi:MAG: signal recognition particle-docking protein FtsY [Candidatus Pacearchaeota archaeon]